MAMLDIRKVRMRVNQHIVTMRMSMRLVAVPWKGVFMSMMRIVDMRVIVFPGFVPVCMLVTLGDMQPDARAHQDCSGAELHAHRFVLYRDG